MDLLIDTHVLLWSESRTSRLGSASRAMIESKANTIFVSAASIYEIALKARLGKLNFNGSPSAVAEKYGFVSLPITAEAAEHAAQLSWTHPDPFDRLIVGQAIVENLVLISADTIIEAFGGVTFFDATR
jgi:PIN domain nuclease of toxin-antitoxin system